MKRAMISGATGAIGLALIQELIHNGIEVLVLCRKDSERNNKIPENVLITKKICSLDQLSLLQNDTGKEYDVFYHLAWDGTFGPSRNDMQMQAKNIEYTLDAVQVAKRFGCKKFVGVGSQAEYGPVKTVLTPTTPTFPLDGYGMAKLCAGQMTRIEANRLGLHHNWVRVLSVYGPNDGEKTLVMSLIKNLRMGIAPECTSGDQIWDYLFSEDAALALRLIGEEGVNGQVYVLGSGEAKPLKDYIKQIQELVNPFIEIKYGYIPYSKNQVMFLQADISELVNDTGFVPKVDFSTGIQKILENHA
ncbi:CDP-abequose synthase [bioreactor metagenome]|uniref:CDP-abequose synthase n=1 Tax=bioreactor metagenome TaxID=1076179 RepID=A0A645BRZ1_9ZZZZ